jgi:hyperosmotically inducible protein
MTTTASSVVAHLRLAARTKGTFTMALAAVFALSSAAHAEARPDVWISTQVRSGLLTAEGLGHTGRIHIDTIDGRVTLYGTVANEAQKAKAEEIARRVEGTTSVRNLLQVVADDAKKGTALADKVIEKNVATVLKGDPALADSQIKVRSVDNGVVLLAGTAKTLSDHLRALEVAARVDGVRRIASEIVSPNALGDGEIWRDGAWDPKVAERSAAADLWTTSAVKLRLLANMDTPGFDINVDTADGVVTLFGVVDSAKTKAAAEEEARKVDSARNVRNELQVVAPAAQAAMADKDSDIKAAVQKRLAANSLLSDAKLDVDVKNGVVRISGNVTSQLDRLTALTVARTTKGTRRVVDDIKLVPTKVTAR